MKHIAQLLALSFILSTLNAAESTNQPLFEIRRVVNMPTTQSQRMILVHKDRSGQVFEEPLNVAKRAPGVGLAIGA